VSGLITALEKQEKFGEAEELLNEGLAIVARMDRPFKEEETEEMQAIAENFAGLKKCYGICLEQ
jgi:hypothetical protein